MLYADNSNGGYPDGFEFEGHWAILRCAPVGLPGGPGWGLIRHQVLPNESGAVIQASILAARPHPFCDALGSRSSPPSPPPKSRPSHLRLV